MRGVNVLIWGDEELARAMAKRGTVSDVTLYNHLAGNLGGSGSGSDTGSKEKVALTLAAPSRYPEKLQSLLTAMALSEAAVLVVDRLTPELGETLLALDAVGMAEGFLVLRGQMTAERLAPLLEGTVAEGYEVVGDEADGLRRRLLALEPAAAEGETLVDVDACFSVKGIGVVVLGVVRRGILTKGQQLQLYPGKRLVQIRSIQVHDVDVREAGSGCRVGLAIKNAEVGHFDRGSVLAVPQSQQVAGKLAIEVASWSYFKEDFAVDMVFHLGAGLQLAPARVTQVEMAGELTRLTLELEKPLVLHKERGLTLSYLNAKGPRLAGKVTGWSTATA